MPSNGALDQPNQVRRVWLSIAALLIDGLIFGPFYFFEVIQSLVPSTFRLVPPWFIIPTLIVFLDALLFSHLAIYLLASVLTIVLALVALVWGHPGWIARLPLVLVLVSVAAFPWFYRYQPAVVAAPGFDLRVPTQPGLLDGVTKKAQTIAEITPCEYTLLGWTAENVLYYRETCRLNDQIWAYGPAQDNQPRRMTEIPSVLFQGAPPYQMLGAVRVPGVFPPEAEPQARDVVLRRKGSISPNARWVALVARHFYGPEDVVVAESK